ncbi:adhesion G-protein coupled receptor D1-like [Actinia tenebrosa]|uniref:Adhesion G-protein coupled receptor D1-like n=1 Tax=Actinia tenebrosa TaxID=6105 RepID=A0A6P8IIM1_ACTTE|nr:adhesion G-protein coupled receptor D1-like [Actinia tenebrosa]
MKPYNHGLRMYMKRYIFSTFIGIPAVIVVVTLVSSFDGYGTKNSCWLSVEKGTIWSFVVPVLVIVLVNAIILALVVREILKLYNPTPADETKLQSVRSGIKSATVLLPILGIAWVFGILAVNTETIVFQYLFAIFNSLQVSYIRTIFPSIQRIPSIHPSIHPSNSTIHSSFHLLFIHAFIHSFIHSFTCSFT